MYAYIFDNFLQDRKFQHETAQIENRLTTLGIQGKIEKMTILKNIQEATRQAIKRGATTIVVVGNDETITKVLPQLIDQDITFGLIPLGSKQTIAKILGIPLGEPACDILSRRITQRIDLGKANTAYFIFTLQTPPGVIANCGQYTISNLDQTGSMTIANFPIGDANGRPDDGSLELIVSPAKARGGWGRLRASSGSSIFQITTVKLISTGEPISVLLDGLVPLKTPVTVEVAPNKLEVIVGKERGF